MKTIFIIIMIFLFTACSDNAIISKSKTELKNVQCMRLVVFPPNKFLSETMHQLYTFDEHCKYKLSVSQKSGIVCNSNQNTDKKILANFPSGYIRLNLSNGSKAIFSYYRDLTHRANKEDLKKAFKSLQIELK